MQIVSKASPHAQAPHPNAGKSAEAAKAAKAKAIAMLSGQAAPQAPSASPSPSNNAQATPVANPNQIAPEEMSALKTPSQNDSVEAASSEDPSQTESSAAPEAPAATAEASTEESSPLSSQYANLARKEKALRAKAMAQESQLKAKEAEFAAREAALKAKEAEYGTKYVPKDKLAEDPFSVLAELGLTYDELTQRALNAPKPEELAQQAYQRKLEAKISELEAKQEKIAKSYEEGQQASYQQAIRQIKSETQKLVSSDPQFEAIKETNSVDDVVELIERTFKEDGNLLTVEEAARMVEDHLVEEAMKFTKFKKIQQRLAEQSKAAQAPAKPQPSASPSSAPKSQQQPIKTLTNAVSANRPLTARERAILAARGELKK